MNVNLTDAQLGPIIEKAILDSLTPDVREKLIGEALKDILNKKTGTAYSSSTIIQDAFERAAYKLAADIATQILTEPEHRAKLDSIIRAGIDAAFVEQGEKLVANVAKAVVEAFTVKDRY